MICPDPTTASRQADPSQTEVRPPTIFQQPDETVRLQYVDIWLLYGWYVRYTTQSGWYMVDIW